MSESAHAFDLSRTYVHLHDGPAAVPVKVGADFWATIDRRTDLTDGRLVMIFRYAKAVEWDHWEMHPAGDEIVCLLSGALDLVLEEDGRERIVELRDHATCIVPRGVWHTGTVRAPSETLHITRGAGTVHRARPSA
jgi:mannose-6-phosphate isomerase-like protein (cupin superfamily)